MGQFMKWPTEFANPAGNLRLFGLSVDLFMGALTNRVGIADWRTEKTALTLAAAKFRLRTDMNRQLRVEYPGAIDRGVKRSGWCTLPIREMALFRKQHDRTR